MSTINNRITQYITNTSTIQTILFGSFSFVWFIFVNIVIMHIIINRRRQKINRRERAVSSLLFYASILQIFAHGLNAQLLTEKIPLGKSFIHFYQITFTVRILR